MVTTEMLARSIVRCRLRLKEFAPVLIRPYPHTIEISEQIALDC